MADERSTAAELHAQVLIVDDEVDHARTMADALRKPGHVCTIVHSLADATKELTGGAFDVVVTDLVMETPTAGLEVLRLQREHQPEAATLLVTAHGDVPTAKAALQGGPTTSSRSPWISWSSGTWCSGPRRPSSSATRTSGSRGGGGGLRVRRDHR